jgi:hypothetical protein
MEKADLENLGLGLDRRVVIKCKLSIYITQFCGPKLVDSEWNQ